MAMVRAGLARINIVLDFLQLSERTKMSRKFLKLLLNTDNETIAAIDELSGITWCSVQRILSGDLGMPCVPKKFMHRFLIDDQKGHREETCHDSKSISKPT
ncbi:hypothetical protein CDAR_490291 [Caerostris darwini]|uniref:Uncharacterized protein n=1 Tax=Caerostris darwini TaxID=1538125 RepID=A0AAV4R1Z3_9ARAC|nr:hypothetical protein CDAR_490291 [Caerostris darwini]